MHIKSKTSSNDQELIQSDSIFRPRKWERCYNGLTYDAANRFHTCMAPIKRVQPKSVSIGTKNN